MKPTCIINSAAWFPGRCWYVSIQLALNLSSTEWRIAPAVAFPVPAAVSVVSPPQVIIPPQSKDQAFKQASLKKPMGTINSAAWFPGRRWYVAEQLSPSLRTIPWLLSAFPASPLPCLSLWFLLPRYPQIKSNRQSKDQPFYPASIKKPAGIINSAAWFPGRCWYVSEQQSDNQDPDLDISCGWLLLWSLSPHRQPQGFAQNQGPAATQHQWRCCDLN